MRQITTQDFRFMLESAKEHLDELPELYNWCLRENQVPKRLTNKIRYFLNDIESALDYISYEIFNNYCLKNIVDPAKIESLRKQVNFPLYDNKDWFNKKMEKVFLGLRSERPDIIEILEKCQPFITGRDYWLPVFNRLVNNNKHRELEKQQLHIETHVHYGQIGNIKIKNSTFHSFGGFSPLAVNNNQVDITRIRNYDENAISETKIEFVFKYDNLPVLPTLYKIYDGVHCVINELDNAMKGG